MFTLTDYLSFRVFLVLPPGYEQINTTYMYTMGVTEELSSVD